MTSIIRADTEQLRAVARQMRGLAGAIADGSASMQRAVEALDTTWSGNARDRGMAYWGRIMPHYGPAAAALEQFAAELDGLAARLDAAAAVFGDGLSLQGAISNAAEKVIGAIKDLFDADGPRPAEELPTNPFGMFEKVRGEPEIKVFRVGENDYFVTIDGTDGWHGANSWPNAVASGLGLGTVYTKLLKDALRRLPEGATVHMFGYSQGGLVAQNIALETSFFSNQKLNLASVNTFGSPHEMGRARGVEYNAFDAEGDLVSKLALPGLAPTKESLLSIDLFRNVAGLGGASLLYGSTGGLGLSGAYIVGGKLSDDIASIKEGGTTHKDAYTQPDSAVGQKMRCETLPFTPNRWELVDTVDDTNIDAFDTGRAMITEQLAKPAEQAVHLYNKAADLTGDVAEQGVELAGKGFDMVKGFGNSMRNLF